MLSKGFVGGALGARLLRRLGRRAAREAHGAGDAYSGRRKLEALFGPSVWRKIAGRTVMDVGCGMGLEALEMAARGARQVIGLDIRESMLDQARREAARRRLDGRCLFTTHTDERADLVFSIDGFEHYDNPEGMLQRLRALVDPEGRVMIAFGPPWFHPLGGHLFSIFPWAHLIFTERALLDWRAQFKDDGATRFREVAGGLNQMTVRHFGRLVARSDFEVATFEAVPIRQLRWLAGPLTREFLTSTVRCILRPQRDREETFACAG